jgi:CO dehydrogenase nickel-insertion accessory protein CooC1
LSKLHLEHLCEIPYDRKLEDAIFTGEPLRNLSDTPALEAIESILKKV